MYEKYISITHFMFVLVVIVTHLPWSSGGKCWLGTIIDRRFVSDVFYLDSTHWLLLLLLWRLLWLFEGGRDVRRSKGSVLMFPAGKETRSNTLTRSALSCDHGLPELHILLGEASIIVPQFMEIHTVLRDGGRDDIGNKITAEMVYV